MSAGRGVVIVGGGPAGLATARAFRDAGGGGPVTIVAAEPHAPYERPPLTKDFLRGDAAEHDLPIEDELWFARHEVGLRTGVRATALDLAARRVALDDGGHLDYEHCVLATGAEPQRLPVPGADDPGRPDHAQHRGRAGAPAPRLAGWWSSAPGSWAARRRPRWRARGAAVTVVTAEALPQSERLGPEAGGRIAAWMEDAGVELMTGTELSGIDARRVRLARPGRRPRRAGRRHGADGGGRGPAAGPGPGRRPAAGRRRAWPPAPTCAPAIRAVLAVGDVAYAHNAAAGRPLRVEHWGEALAHGAVAGAVLAGQEPRWSNAPGFWSAIADHTLKYVAWGDGFAARAPGRGRRRRLHRLVRRCRRHVRRRALPPPRRRLRARARARGVRSAHAVSSGAALLRRGARPRRGGPDRRLPGRPGRPARRARAARGRSSWSWTPAATTRRARWPGRRRATRDLAVTVLDGPGRGAGPARRVGMDAAAARLPAGRPDRLHRRRLDGGPRLDRRPAARGRGRRAGDRRPDRDRAHRDRGAAARRGRWTACAASTVVTSCVLADPGPPGSTSEHWQFSGASLAVTADVYRRWAGWAPTGRWRTRRSSAR